MTDVNQNWQSIREVMRPINQSLFDSLGDRVKRGPFQGMRLGRDVKWDDGNIGTKLLGSYEFELHKIIEKAIRRNPNTVINVGCAEGYYAVGLSKLLPDSFVYAVDMDNDSLDQCERNAVRNNVNRNNFRTAVGKPSPYGLFELAKDKGRCLFFLDVEGDETYLLNKEECSLLDESDIVVECHDFLWPNIPDSISSVLSERFSNTHDIEWIMQQVPYPGDYPFLSGMPIGKMLLAITEKRPTPTVWLACWTRN